MSLKERWRLQTTDSKLMAGCVVFIFLAGIFGQCDLGGIAFSFGSIAFIFGVASLFHFLNRIT